MAKPSTSNAKRRAYRAANTKKWLAPGYRERRLAAFVAKRAYPPEYHKDYLAFRRKVGAALAKRIIGDEIAIRGTNHGYQQG